MMECRKQFYKQKGFTLIEVLIGMSVWTILLMSLIASIPNISLVIQKSATIKGANTVGNNKIEYFRTLPFDEIRDSILPQSPIFEKTTLSGNNYFTLTTLKKVTINEVSTNAVSVEVNVYWFPTAVSSNTWYQSLYLHKYLASTYWTMFTKNGLSDKQFIESY